MRIIKEGLLSLAVLGLLIADVVYGYSGLGNIFIGLNIFNFVLCNLIFLTMVLGTEDKKLKEIVDKQCKITHYFDAVIIFVLVYFGWWFNTCLWGFGIVTLLVLKQYVEDKTKEK